MTGKTSEVLKQLEAGIQSLFDSDRYREYLRFLARFHTYSTANTVLIFTQMPFLRILQSSISACRM